MIKPEDLIAKFQFALNNGWGYIMGAAGVMWTQSKQDATTNEMAKKYGKKWIGHMVADCSGLFAWAFKELGSYMYHGSNTMYRSYTTARGELKKGQRTDGGELKPGTAVFTWKEQDQKYGHVGLYIGGGIVIEAYGTIKGVITSKVTENRWTNWGWLRDVEGGEAPIGRPTLRKGDKGTDVKDMQELLLLHGYGLGKYGADGAFGNATLAAVKAFQKENGLTADGVCGPNTWDALLGGDTSLYTVTIEHLPKGQMELLKSQFPDAIIAKENEE